MPISLATTRHLLALAIALSGCSASAERDDETADGKSDEVATPEGDDAIGTVTTKTDDEPTITKVTTYHLGDGSFPTYLAHTVGANSPNGVFQNVTIKNPSALSKTVVLRASLSGYTKKESVATITLKPGEEKAGKFDVTLDFESLSKIATPVSATFDVQLETQDGRLLFAARKATRLHSKNTVFWKDVFTTAAPAGRAEKLVASATFTTPRDNWGEIDKLLQQAAPYSSKKAMYGYGGYYKENNTPDQNAIGASDVLEAIWSALQARGFNYTSVSGSFFDGAQTVRYPAETLRASTGNCIDGTLVFASALEAIGMNPVFIYGPGHAFIGLHIAPTGDEMIVVETTMLGSSDYVSASKSAAATYKKWEAAGTLTRFDLAEARKQNWLPAPYPM